MHADPRGKPAEHWVADSADRSIDRTASVHRAIGPRPWGRLHIRTFQTRMHGTTSSIVSMEPSVRALVGARMRARSASPFQCIYARSTSPPQCINARSLSRASPSTPASTSRKQMYGTASAAAGRICAHAQTGPPRTAAAPSAHPLDGALSWAHACQHTCATCPASASLYVCLHICACIHITCISAYVCHTCLHPHLHPSAYAASPRSPCASASPPAAAGWPSGLGRGREREREREEGGGEGREGRWGEGDRGGRERAREEGKKGREVSE